MLEVVRQEMDIVVSQCCFTAALCVPNDAFFKPLIQFFFKRFGCKDLRVAHDVFFDTLCLSNVSQGIFQDKSQPSATE